MRKILIDINCLVIPVALGLVNLCMPSVSAFQKELAGKTEAVAYAQVSNYRQGILLDKKAKSILDKLKVSVRCNYFEQRFRDVINEWAADHGINVVLHESAADNGLDAESVITKRLIDISFQAVARNICSDFDCGFVIVDQVMMIVSNDYLESYPQLMVFDCNSMVEVDGEARKQFFAKLCNEIKEEIAPKTWLSNGGAGAIVEVGGFLIVRNSLRQIEQVESFVEKIYGDPNKKIKRVFNIAKRGKRKRWGSFSDSKSNEILDALEQTAEVDYFENRFDDVMSDFGRILGVDFGLHESTQDTPLDNATLVTRKLDSIALKSTIRIVLREYDCDFVIADQKILIASKDYASDNLQTMSFDCRKLAEAFGGDQKHRMKTLANAIVSTISPDSWMSEDGAGTISEANGILTVRNRLAVLEHIEALIGALGQ